MGPKGGEGGTPCYAIMPPCRKSAFRAGFWPDCYRESSSDAYVLTCCMPLANSACAVMLFIAGSNFARRTEQLLESKPCNH